MPAPTTQHHPTTDGAKDPQGFPRDPIGIPKGPQRDPEGPKGSPKGAKWAPKSSQGHPKAIPRATKTSQKDKLYINKLPINRLRGRYVNIVYYAWIILCIMHVLCGYNMVFYACIL